MAEHNCDNIILTNDNKGPLFRDPLENGCGHLKIQICRITAPAGGILVNDVINLVKLKKGQRLIPELCAATGPGTASQTVELVGYTNAATFPAGLNFAASSKGAAVTLTADAMIQAKIAGTASPAGSKLTFVIVYSDRV